MSAKLPPQVQDFYRQAELDYEGFWEKAALDASNQEAIHHHLAYTDFLELLIEDELAKRRDRLFARRLKQSHIPGVKDSS